MTIPGITEIASQDLFGWGNIPKFTGDLWFVDAGAGVSGNGQLPDTAFLTIAEGIAAAAAGDAVSIKAGTYDEAGLDVSKDGLELWGEEGVIVADSTPGTALVVSADYCFVESLRLAQSGQVGLHVTGAHNGFLNVRSATGNSMGFDIDGVNNHFERCFAGTPTATGFDIGANGCTLFQCNARGNSGATRGFYVRGGVQHTGAYDCSSLGNGTAGWETGASANYNIFQRCTSGGGDGDRVDSGENNIWPSFADRQRRETHEHGYPTGAGEGAAHDPVTVDNTTTNDAAGTREDQNYWGDIVRVIPPDILTAMWFSLGVYIYANTASDIQQWQAFYTNDLYVTTQNGGLDWDHNEVTLTVADGSIILTNDLVWITGVDRPDGEIMKVTNVVGNVITVASETRASGGAGLRYDYDLGGGGQTMYVVYRPSNRMLHGFDGDYSAASAKAFMRNSWYAPKLILPNGGMLMRMLNASDALASSFDVRAIYED